MTASYRIYSQDAFLTVGISSLLDSILSMNISFKDKKLNILLISNISLLNIAQFCHSLDHKKTYFVIGSAAAWDMINGTGIMKLEGFIDISKSLNELKHELYFMLKGGREFNTYPIQTEKIILSPCERFVLRYISSGMPAASIAKRLGLSVKTISSQKRSMMKKLNVSSNQQLLIKARMANY
ncbi:helix-turn-helix transcriptional regulator (plasmid) [Hafnia alvei]|uniref:helix-turn-helix domain-containing protein n=1 Tax=Hafnia alvei TaxID=569 RepID=UPI0028BD3ECC|nr:helix-turn-helix transcriptional regulator [Hafnia alvei]WNN54798.1 helix-turn-helix transcriptional regulator [Hafnia alvei]